MFRSLLAKIILCIVVMELLGGLGTFLTAGSIPSWYATLSQPPGTPPNEVFGPVWSILYAMIGTSFALIWHQGALGKNQLTLLFFAQLFLNLIWTPIFFGAHLLIPALIVILLMGLFIALTIRAFAKNSKPAAWLLVPYLLWVSYATYLNAGYAFLN
ncbi:TspO/MBR family protein [Verrucomicrobiaceae bacterium 227]